jgi:oligosaccharide repeat unit polymerase
MLKSFIYSWLIYWILALVLPVHSIYPAVMEAFFLQMSFVGLVCLGYVGAISALAGPRMPTSRQAEVWGARRVVRLAILLSLIGLIFLVYDKAVIQGIDYSDGLAVAREQWRQIGEEREGRASSRWSALGYLIGSGYYVMLVVLLVQPHRFSGRERLAVIGIAFVFALANSVITGGRSNFMLILVFALAALSARRGINLATVFPERRHRRAVALVSMTTLSYLVYVFYDRAQAGGELVTLYVVNFLPYLGLDFDPWYGRIADSGWLATVGHMTILVVGYLTHSLATFAAIVDAPSEDKVILFGNAAGILYKLELIGRPEGDWFLAGRFPSVPGALWHQFGPLGFLIGSLLIGLSAGLCASWAARARRGLFPLGMYTMAGATLMLTPYVFAPDLLSFPFVFSAFVILALLGRITWRGRRRQSPALPLSAASPPWAAAAV